MRRELLSEIARLDVRIWRGLRRARELAEPPTLPCPICGGNGCKRCGWAGVLPVTDSLALAARVIRVGNFRKADSLTLPNNGAWSRYASAADIAERVGCNKSKVIAAAIHGRPVRGWIIQSAEIDDEDRKALGFHGNSSVVYRARRWFR